MNDEGLDMRDGSQPAAAAPTAARYLRLDPARFSDTHAQKFTHELRGHPLMTLESFAKLALRRPPDRVRVYDAEYVTAGENIEQVADKHGTARTLDEMVRDIEQNRTYLFIMNVETDPVFAPLARELLNEVKLSLRPLNRAMVRGWAWVFISAPNAVTPYHRDHEQTCLFQLQGKKTLSVWSPQDREVCSEDENEHFHLNWSLAKTALKPHLQPRAEMFELTPGEMLYMPFSAPHWVQNGPETSVSFSVTYATEDTDVIENAYRMNAVLRKKGLSPKPVGESLVRDTVKDRAWRVYKRARGALRGADSSAIGQ